MTEKFTCIIVDDEPLAVELLIDQLTHLFRNIKIGATCTYWEEALELMQTTDFDILFMDISMPGKNGIDLLKLLPKSNCEVIFITAHEEYAIEAFNFKVSGYLLKPVSDNDLSQAIHRAIERISIRRTATHNSHSNTALSEKIGIPGKYGIDYINTHDIIYLESVNKCTRIVTASKDYLSLSPLVKFRTLTETHPFLQVHRSFIINLNSVLRYESSGIITMSNKQDIPVARSFRSELLQHFNTNF